MRQALSVAWESLLDWWNGMVGLATINVMWLGLSLTGLLLPPATAGMYAVTNSVAHGTGQRTGDFIQAARRYFWVSWRWALLNLLVIAILAVNLAFYGAIEGPLAVSLRAFVLVVALLWLAIQFYVWPFLMEQTDKRLSQALRNALFLSLGAPVYTLTMLIVTGLVILVSVAAILPIAVFLVSFLSLLGNRAVLERLAAYGKLPTISGDNDHA